MDVVLPEEKERLSSNRDRLLKGWSDVGEWMLLSKDGKYLPVEVSTKMLPDGRWLALCRDISERKRTEETLRQTQERLELALTGGELASWDWNIDTGDMITNSRCAEMRGFRPEEIRHHLGWYVANIHPDDLPGFQRAVADSINGASPEFEHEYRTSTKGGTWIWLLSRGKIFERDAAGRPIRMVGTSLDITARKDAEQALRLSEAAARRAARTRDDVLGIVAHDLRNPLAAITMLAASLQMQETQREIGDEIAHATDRMRRLIRDLVDVTLLDAGTFAIKQERVGTAGVLYRVLESQASLASLTHLGLRLDAEPGLPDLWVDHDRLLQVFENLIGNAIKFTQPGGQIVLGAIADGDKIRFSVTDTGCGIESDHLPRVFDRFWQARDQDKRRGAGLGLPIVKGIVEAHGGCVWVQSVPGKGSTFFFTMPAHREREIT
jgi:PAS domain S-box-containing protein